jgi:hypothetical protein
MRLAKFWVLLSTVLMIQCDDDDPMVYTLDEPFEVQDGQFVTLTWGEEDKYIDLQVIDIDDSRCPDDVVCVRFGEAEVIIGINGTEEIVNILELCIGDCPQRSQRPISADTAQVELDNVGYAVILNDVVPFPTTTNQSVTKKAVLKVIRW